MRVEGVRPEKYNDETVRYDLFLSQNCLFDSHIKFHRCENDNEL